MNRILMIALLAAAPLSLASAETSQPRKQTQFAPAKPAPTFVAAQVQPMGGSQAQGAQEQAPAGDSSRPRTVRVILPSPYTR